MSETASKRRRENDYGGPIKGTSRTFFWRAGSVSGLMENRRAIDETTRSNHRETPIRIISWNVLGSWCVQSPQEIS